MVQGLWAVFWPPDSDWEDLTPILEELSEKDRAGFHAIPQDPRGDERRRQLLFSRALLPLALQESLLKHPKNSTKTPAITSLPTAPTPPVPSTEHPFSAPPEIPAELAETLTFTGFTAPAHPADTPIPASPAALSEPAESLSFADVPAPVGGKKPAGKPVSGAGEDACRAALSPRLSGAFPEPQPHSGRRHPGGLRCPGRGRYRIFPPGSPEFITKFRRKREGFLGFLDEGGSRRQAAGPGPGRRPPPGKEGLPAPPGRPGDPPPRPLRRRRLRHRPLSPAHRPPRGYVFRFFPEK